MSITELAGETAALFDNVTKALVAAGTLIAAALTGVAVRARKEPPPPDTQEGMRVAIANLTRSMEALKSPIDAQGGQFAENIELMHSMCRYMEAAIRALEDIRAGSKDANAHMTEMRISLTRIADLIRK